MRADSAAGAPIMVTAADGTALAARVFEPAGSRYSPVLIAGGLGINQRFYAPFASWLAARGHCVMTFDLRGMGLSRPPGLGRSLRWLAADMLTWARQDFAAAVQALSNHCGGAPIALVGHSVCGGRVGLLARLGDTHPAQGAADAALGGPAADATAGVLSGAAPAHGGRPAGPGCPAVDALVPPP